jgi:hypothetical protein
MNFQRVKFPGLMADMTAYAARAGKWNFLIVEDMGRWTASYRLDRPTAPVSASSTIMGPFDTFHEADVAAHAKLAELRRLA